MQNNYNIKNQLCGKHLTFTERKLIEIWKNKEKLSNREIARRLGRCHQTINNEMIRGQVDLTFSGHGIEYSAVIAQENYDLMRTAVGKTDIWTPEKSEIIKNELLIKHSPEVISNMDNMPSFRTIYNWINKGWISGITRSNLIYPRKKKTTMIPQNNRRPRKQNVLSIEKRPEIINTREEVGHFEIDLVILNHRKGQQLLTLTDRKTRLAIIRLIPDKTAESVNQMILKLKQEYHIKSITADNGSEFLKLDEVIDCPIYYAHPYASFERGSNENMNRLIRRWIPKGVRHVTHEFVLFIEEWIRNYPRKLFNYRSSNDLEETKLLFVR